MVGAGKLGGALLGFEGFSKFNLNIVYVFDADKNKIGKIKKGIKINDVKNMRNIVRENGLKIAVIATPPEVAQIVTNDLVEAGVKGILNFSPRALKVPEYVSVSNVDMACELESLIFFANET